MALVALGAASAGAAQAFEWEVNGQTLSARGLSSESTAGSGGAFEISGTILGQPTTITCSSSSSAGSITTGGTGSSTLTLSGCTAPAPCTVASSIALNATTTQLIEAGGVLYEKYSSPESKFASVKISSCAIAGTYPLKGSFAAAGIHSDRTEQSLSFSGAINTASGTSMTFGGNSASMTGSLSSHLSGANTGASWGPEGLFEWRIGSSAITSPQSVIQGVKPGSGSLSFTINNGGSIGKFSCSGESLSKGTINAGGTAGAEAINLTGCAMTEPAGCSVPTSIATSAVHATVKSLNGYVYETYSANSGNLFTLKISGGCSLAGSYGVTGSFTAKRAELGAEQQTQPLTLSPAVDAAVGSVLHFGASSTLQVSGSLVEELASGQQYGAFSLR